MEKYTKERQNIMEFLQDREAEIIVLLEGTDEVSGTAVQARHSYRWDDMKFDCTFSNCIFSMDGDDHMTGNSLHDKRMLSKISLDCEMGPSSSRMGSTHSVKCMIDFRKFHSVIAAPLDGDFSAFIPHWIYDPLHEKIT